MIKNKRNKRRKEKKGGKEMRKKGRTRFIKLLRIGGIAVRLTFD